MDNKEFYEKIGGDYIEMMDRFGSDALIGMFAKKYEKDNSYEKLADAVEKGDIKASFEAAHTLKGVSANLCFGNLLKSVDALTEQLRSQTEPADIVLFEKVRIYHEEVIEQLKNL